MAAEFDINSLKQITELELDSQTRKSMKRCLASLKVKEMPNANNAMPISSVRLAKV